MNLSRRHAASGRVWWLAPLVALVATGVTATLAAFVVTVRVARLVTVPVRTRREDVTVHSVDRHAGTVTLSAHPDATVPGRYALYFSGDRGLARVGEIVSIDEQAVTRLLIAESRGRLRPGLAARMSGIFYETPEEVGLKGDDVVVNTEHGPAPAWLVPGSDPTDRWVIQVHGRGVDRREAVRSLRLFHEAGLTSLLISYRNDGTAPDSPDGMYALGDTEWEDVEAAIQLAVDSGARDIVLMGWSMGGALVLQSVIRSPLAGVVRGVILDSPVIDWVRVLDHQAGTRRIPAAIRNAAYRLMRSAWGRAFTRQARTIDLSRLDLVARAAELSLPVLLMHSDSDTFVPSTGSRALARLRPDIVTFVPFSGAGHTRLWNYDEERWSQSIRDWLEKSLPIRPTSSR